MAAEAGPAGNSSVRHLPLFIAGAASVLLACILPYVSFYSANLGLLSSPSRLYAYLGWTVLCASAAALALKLVFRSAPAWRIMTAVSVGVYIFFAHRAWLQGLFGPPEGTAQIIAALLSWLAVTVLALFAVMKLVKQPGIVWLILALLVAFNIPPLVNILATGSGAEAGARSGSADVKPAKQAKRPRNIYWVVLDGYPRDDVLAGQFGYDNEAFRQVLERNGFRLMKGSAAAFPVTEYSISSTLMMDYGVENGGTTVPKAGELYPIMRGHNAVTDSLAGYGYRYVHYENGYSHGNMCAADQAICISGNKGFDEIDIKLLGNTPILDFLVLAKHSQTTDLWKNPTPDRENPFGWGGVAALTAKLPAIWETEAPFFLYAHIISPHPPIRFDRNCNGVSARPDLETWAASERPAFVEQIECTNTQAGDLLSRIISRDPDAIIILQSDHGSAFRGQLSKSASAWDPNDIRERFGVLNAMRLPDDCQESLRPDLGLINTFPVVLTCITGEEVPLVPQRSFVTYYINSPDYTKAFELPVEATGLSAAQ